MEELIQKFNLPDYIMKAKSFSEASSMIMKKFDERTDPTSKRTMNEMMGRLRDAQEYVKSQVEPQPNEEQPIQEQVPQGEEQFAYGGKMNKYNLGGLFEGLLGQGGQGASQLSGLFGNAIGGQAGQTTNNILSGTITGASIGSVVPGIGTAIGAGVGALASGIGELFGGGESAEESQMRRDQVGMNRGKLLNPFNYGGMMMNKYQEGGLQPIDLQSRGIVRPGPDFATNLASTMPTGVEEASFLERLGDDTSRIATDVGQAIGQGAEQAGQFLGDNTSALRYTPAAINAFQAFNLERPGVTTLDRLDARYNPQYADEQALQNIAREQFNTTNEALAGASGGSTSALRSNILASGLNRGRSVSDAYQRAAAANRAENRAGQQFDLGIDRANLAQANLEEDIRARDEGAFETQRSGALSRLGRDLGAIGKEEAQQDIIEKLFGYDREGNYLNKRRPRARGINVSPRPGLANTPFNPLSLNLSR